MAKPGVKYTISYVYGLIDPRDNKVKYVGVCVNIQDRYRQHLSSPELKKKTYKANWIKKLKLVGLSPIIKILQVVSINDRDKAEREWIEFFGRENLTNGTDGGEGQLGAKISEKRKELSRKLMIGNTYALGYKKSEEMILHHKEVMKKHYENKEFGEELSNLEVGKKKRTDVSSKYVGVHYNSTRKRWQAVLIYKRVRYGLGQYKTEAEAALAYNDKATELFGDDAKINILSEEETDFIKHINRKIVKPKMKTSKYNYVYHDSTYNYYNYAINIGEIRYNGGHYKYEVEAALAVNEILIANNRLDKLNIISKKEMDNLIFLLDGKPNSKKQKSSKYNYVYLDKENNKYNAEIMKDGVKYKTGYFQYEIETAMAVNEILLELYGFKAQEKLNKISQEEIDWLWNHP